MTQKERITQLEAKVKGLEQKLNSLILQQSLNVVDSYPMKIPATIVASIREFNEWERLESSKGDTCAKG